LIFKKKYHLDPVTLQYVEIPTSRGLSLRSLLIFIAGTMMMALFSGYVLHTWVGSHETFLLKKHLTALNNQAVHLLQKSQFLYTRLQKSIIKHDNQYRAILQIDPLDEALRIAGTGGTANKTSYYQYNGAVNQLDKMIRKMNFQLQVQYGSFDDMYLKAREYAKYQTHLPAIQPVSQTDLIMISSHFGWRSDPFLFMEQLHSGLDFVTPVGCAVHATGDGVVTFVQHSRKGYGNEVLINHKFGFGSRYAHLHEIHVREGDTVRRGQIIGSVGQSGRATGPHLHYEVLYKSKAVNPAAYYDPELTRDEYAQIINKANNN
jgi:murein DD-endopeptidase MepM/ murein hydrolase activator NlpD